LTQQKQSLSLFKTGKAVSEIQSDLENRVYHDQEGDKGSFSGGQHMDSQKSFDERKNIKSTPI
jgi:hypothetical protein